MAAAALAKALGRAQRLVDDSAGAVWYGARRIVAFALMIYGLALDQVELYLHARSWLTGSARLLAVTPEALAEELLPSVLGTGMIVQLTDGCTRLPTTRPLRR